MISILVELMLPSSFDSLSDTFALSEELLIDFRELISEHSGENMGHAVYDTMKKYGLRGKVKKH